MAPPAEAPQTASSFPQVGISEVLVVLHDIGLPWITAEEINKPTQQIAYKVFSQWLETLSGVNQEWLERRKAEVLMDMDHKDLYDESLSWVLFYREITTLMHAAQVTGFTSQDILKPQAKKFKRHLSALVNFYRFRAERMEEYEEFMAEMEELIDRKQDLEHYRESAKERITTIKAQREREAPRAAALAEENEELGRQLYELKKAQTKLIEEVEELKTKKTHLAESQGQLASMILVEHERVQRLQNRIVADPQKMRESLETLASELKERRSHLLETERRAKDFDARIGLMRTIEEDLQSCKKALLNVSTEQNAMANAQKDMREKVREHEETLSSLSYYKQALSADSKQLENATARYNRMKKVLEDKRVMWRKKEEEWNKKLDETDEERRRRNEETLRRQKEGREIEREVEAELRRYDAEVGLMVKQRNELFKLAEYYMDSVTEQLDLNGEGLIVDTALHQGHNISIAA